MKRQNGTGSVEVLADGRARIRVMVDGKRKQLGPLYPDEATARRTLAAWLAERGEGAIVTTTELTLGAYGDQWLDLRELDGSKRRAVVRSIAGERSVWTRQVLTSDIAKKPLAAIRTSDVAAFARELRKRKALQAITYGRGSTKRTDLHETSRPLSKQQQREALRLVSAVLDHAVEAELLDRNPADGVEVAKDAQRARDLSEDWLRWPEALTVLGCEKLDERNRRAWACAIGLALREGDLAAIELERVDLDCDVPGPGIGVWLEKPQRWHRVPVMPWLVPIIREQIASLPRGARYLFPSPEGTRYSKGYDFGWREQRYNKTHRDGSKTLEREPSALEVAGVKRKIRFHDLRGTCATHLALGTWGRRWSLYEIQGMLAHSDQRVTERYVRRAVDMLAEAAKATPGCPTLPLRTFGATGDSSTIPLTPGPGLEPGTNRLTAPGSAELSREVTPSPGQPQGNRSAELAEQVLVMASEGDPLTLRRALELAALVIEEARAAKPRARRRRGSA